MTDGIHAISVPTPYAVGRVNVYLLEDDPLTLVDTGPNSATSFDVLDRALSERGHRVEDLQRLVITHQHPDHAGLIGILQRRSGAELVCLDLLAPVLSKAGGHIMDEDDQLASDLMSRHGVPREVVVAVASVAKQFRAFFSRGEVTSTLTDGGTLESAGRTWQVHHRPGHSPSDTIFHDRESGVVLGGDHLLGHISSNPLISLPLGGKSGEPDGTRPHALRTYMRSMAETRAMEGVSVVLPGHGDPVEDHAGLITSRFAMHEKRAAKIGRMLDEGPMTAHDIARSMWRDVALSQAFLTISEVLGHLDLLVERGDAVEHHGDALTTFSRP